MKRVVGVIGIIILLLIACVLYLYAKRSSEVLPQLSPTPSLHALYCQPTDLQTSLSLSHGAGNVFGTFTIKNISKQACQIQSDTSIAAEYDLKKYPNIVIEQKGQPQNGTVSLLPNQTLYSQVHYPNGPQCPGPTHTAPITFIYALPGQQKIFFVNQNGSKEQDVRVCDTTSAVTTIEIWNLALQPITPQ
jgi:hypothetical protein